MRLPTVALVLTATVHAAPLPYPVVDGCQMRSHDNHQSIDPPGPGDAFFGEDASCRGRPPTRHHPPFFRPPVFAMASAGRPARLRSRKASGEAVEAASATGFVALVPEDGIPDGGVLLDSTSVTRPTLLTQPAYGATAKH